MRDGAGNRRVKRELQGEGQDYSAVLSGETLTLMDYLLVLPLFLMVAYYIGGPVLLYVSLKITANPTFQSVKLTDFSSKELDNFFLVSRRLAADNFGTLDEYVLASDDPDTQTAIMIMAHPETGDRAIITALLIRFNEEWRPLMQWVEFTTHFEDGARICSNNNPGPDWFAPPPEKRIYRFPSVTDARELYRRHRRAVLCHAPNSPLVYITLDAKSDEWLLRDFRAECEHQRHAGILALDTRNRGAYRLTLRGAFLLTWRLLIPFRNARLLQDRARAAALLTALPPLKEEDDRPSRQSPRGLV